MKFQDNWLGRLVLGIIFTLFMAVVVLLYTIVLIPVFLLEFGVIIIGGATTPVQAFTGLLGIFVLVASFVVTGWAVMYFYKKNTFVYKRSGKKW